MIPGASGTAIGSIPGNDTQGAVYRGGIPQIGLWAWWYHDMATTERLVLPANTTQEQRIRIRNSFRLTPQNWFYTAEPFNINLTNAKNDIRRSEEHTSKLKSLIRISYAFICLKNTTE